MTPHLLVGLAVGLFAGASVMALPLWRGAHAYAERMYTLGVRHGREMQELTQWGADVREALAIAHYARTRDAR